MTQEKSLHLSVMLEEAVREWMVSPDGHYVDGTFGRGGHSLCLLRRLSARGCITAFDKDPQACQHAAQVPDGRLRVFSESYTAIDQLPVHSVTGLLMDLGVSSPQLDDPMRGFSFRHDGPLDMRMDNARGPKVSEWLAQAACQEIAEVVREYGEDRYAGAIAKAIVERRQRRGPIESTHELAQVVAGAVKTREKGKDPATRTFQAFRIFINRELDELRQALSASLRILEPGGKLVVISFHSLEDRMVKQFMHKHSKPAAFDRANPASMLGEAAPEGMSLCDVRRLLPSSQEILHNPRARSAVMRVARRTEKE